MAEQRYWFEILPMDLRRLVVDRVKNNEQSALQTVKTVYERRIREANGKQQEYRNTCGQNLTQLQLGGECNNVSYRIMHIYEAVKQFVLHPTV